MMMIQPNDSKPKDIEDSDANILDIEEDIS